MPREERLTWDHGGEDGVLQRQLCQTLRVAPQDYVRPPTRHVRRDGDQARHARLHTVIAPSFQTTNP